ncbi:MAG: P1 family peptidase, partial [Planctomycetaceae bacterium]|nr:P1 family peptidase [Planctomycetaceae bacterium]
MPDVRAIASVDVRGGAPASRETDLLAPWRPVDRIDALVLAGGSAFGLGTAHGVVEALAARGLGHKTSGGNVPIVPAAAVFDLPFAGTDENGIPHHPPVEAGVLAYAAATATPEWGCVGAGRGATVGKQAGRVHASPGGIGAACLGLGPVQLGAVAAVNALGDVVDAAGTVVSGCRAGPEVPRSLTADRLMEGDADAVTPLENTTLVALLTDAPLDKAGAFRIAIAGHDGLGRAIR